VTNGCCSMRAAAAAVVAVVVIIVACTYIVGVYTSRALKPCSSEVTAEGRRAP
jgi:hypothetical protein